MKKHFEAWFDAKDVSVAVIGVDQIPWHRANGLLSSSATLLHRIDADTWEEAMAAHHIKMGWKSYDPGHPAECPRGCGACYFPQGSGECPNCGKIS